MIQDLPILAPIVATGSLWNEFCYPYFIDQEPKVCEIQLLLSHVIHESELQAQLYYMYQTWGPSVTSWGVFIFTGFLSILRS